MVNDRNLLIVFRNLIATAACAAILTACNIPKPASLSAVSPPTGVTAKSGDAIVTVTWIASVGATSYKVSRSQVSGGPYAQVATTSDTTYTDSTVTNGTTYYYVVSAIDASGEGDYSTQSAANPVAPTAPPPAPTILTATAGDGQATITWSASNSAATYRVKRSTSNVGPYLQIAAPTTTTYVDKSLTNDTTYYFVISAVNSIGESANSNQVSVMPVVMNPPPTTFGTWTNVTPLGIDLISPLCDNFGNFGTARIQADPARQSDIYANFHCQGIWKSTDYGSTWVGPINSGTNGTLVRDCAGGLTVARGPSSTPIIYLSCIRGAGVGFWRSVDGGVNWTPYVVTPSGVRQDYSAPVVDPYDSNHLLMTAHEFDSLVESTDGGVTWTSVHLESGMLQTSLNSSVFFINTGTSTTTRGTWLWIGSLTGGTFGTWRTNNSGANWVKVDRNEGTSQVYQPDSSGLLFIAGTYSDLGWGVLRSKDYGQTWSHVGQGSSESVVFGTTKNVYSMAGAAVGAGGTFNPEFQVGAQPGTGTWVSPSVPGGLSQGPGEVSIVNDGTHNIFVGAMYNAGLWRYVEP